jgi:hypothetical protein
MKNASIGVARFDVAVVLLPTAPARLAAEKDDLSQTCAVTQDVEQTLVSAAPRLRTPEVIPPIGMRQGVFAEPLIHEEQVFLATDEHR